ncbi:uncharacterized protein LOC114815071 isoform X3 [Ornithorhynchus anatinus]|uniref:uncharacterized protein LOC114815071 isoform X3 n=1 Tax=Ornithorhynchus anatinus TaxID=9258 RepID=UPI0010A751C2|nr:uncharacterized protein LOC114815071 isoform X3 [Ornithorhynchus anatinus]
MLPATSIGLSHRCLSASPPDQPSSGAESQPSAPGESKVQWICALEQQPRCNWAVETSTIRVGRVRTSGTVPFPSSSGVLGG